MSQRFETRRFTCPKPGVETAIRQYGESGWIELDRKVVGTDDDGGDLVRVLLKRPLPDPIGLVRNEARHAH